ncbi:hypothetical protein AM501_05435 [Aneurinibacillus migulanus]|nr:alpha/beta hydrolase-fold protein [Aneurinibacillus migulanus]KIV57362.1 hypothetical protein TS64_06895 [Aneurinibacillus migulanus]KPD09225.1 hypothetical protein AM501_05435 [Aneurinibacillus migulanus]
MQGKVDTLSFQGRNIYVYTPPSYEREGEVSFPAIYVQDGNYLFMDSIETLEEDFVQGVTQEVIFVGIEPIERNREYTPWKAEPLVKQNYLGGEGDEYLAFITEKVMPFVQSHYRIIRDYAQTGIGGGSFGALISLYAAFQKPGFFGRFALMSTSLWYENFVSFVEKNKLSQENIRIYMYVGEQEGVGRTNLQQYMVPNTKKTYERLKEKVFGGAKDVLLETDPNGVHNHAFFIQYFPHAVQFLYPGLKS